MLFPVEKNKKKSRSNECFQLRGGGPSFPKKMFLLGKSKKCLECSETKKQKGVPYYNPDPPTKTIIILID